MASKKSGPRPPDYRLMLNPKDDDNRDFNRDVGVAWKTKFGGISLRLNPGIVISYETLQDFFLILTPIETDKK